MWKLGNVFIFGSVNNLNPIHLLSLNLIDPKTISLILMDPRTIIHEPNGQVSIAQNWNLEPSLNLKENGHKTKGKR